MAGGLFSGDSSDTEIDEVTEGVSPASSSSGTTEASPGGLFGEGAASTDATRTANQAADDSEQYAEDSKGWAIGNDDAGLDGWSDTNNSKYYSEQSSASATEASSSATAAAGSASAAATSASNSASSATAADNSATAAASSASTASQQANLSEDWAVGLNPVDGTPSDTNNSHYWSQQAEAANSSASGHSDDADEAAARAQGWAVGEDSSNEDGWSGTNNSKYYSEQSSDSADASSTSAGQAAASATAAANSASAAATSAGAANANAVQAAQASASAIAAQAAAETAESNASASASAASTSAGEAQDWAIGPSGTDDTPSDTNNAHYWALQAQAATDFPDGYPDIPDHESAAVRYELQVPADTGDATWVEVDAASELTAGDGINIQSDAISVDARDATITVASDGISVTNPFTDADETKLDSIPDIPDNGESALKYELQVPAGTGDAVWVETVAHTDALPAVPANESTAINYELQVPANSGDATWVEVDAAGELTAGDGIDISSDTVSVDLYEPTGNFKNAAIITSNKLDVSYETETKDDRLYLDGIFGRRIRGFDNENGIELATYVYNDADFIYTDRSDLYWDEELTSFMVDIDNNSDYQEEFITSAVTSIDGTQVDTHTWTTYAASVAAQINPDELGVFAMDPRTGAYDGTAGGQRNVSTLFTTNEGKTDTQTSSYSWQAAGIDSVNVTDPVVLEFDQYVNSYDIRVVVQNTNDFDNIVNEQVQPGDNFGDDTNFQQTANSTTVTVNSNVGNIYHDTTITGNVRVAFRRPTTVSAETEANRTYTQTHSYSHGASIIYKTWQILATDLGDFSVSSDLGTLNASGYATQATRSADTSTTQWKSANYSFDNGSGTSAVHGYLVAPSSGSTFQDRDLGFGTVAHTSTSVNLGHSGHTIAYTVYTFVVAAGKHLRLEVLS